MTKAVLRSLGITFTVSLIISVCLYKLGLSFWFTFILVTALQFMVWWIVDYIIKGWMAIKHKQIQSKMLEDISKQAVYAPCAYCAAVNLIPIRLDMNNEFDCEMCNKKSAVYIDIETSQITVPIDPSKIEETIRITTTKNEEPA